jgi:hypothetical protein
MAYLQQYPDPGVQEAVRTRMTPSSATIRAAAAGLCCWPAHSLPGPNVTRQLVPRTDLSIENAPPI